MYTGSVVTGFYFVLFGALEIHDDIVGDSVEEVQRLAAKTAEEHGMSMHDFMDGNYEGRDIYQIQLQDIPLDYYTRQHKQAGLVGRVVWEAQALANCKRLGGPGIWNYQDDQDRDDPEWRDGNAYALMSIAGRIEY